MLDIKKLYKSKLVLTALILLLVMAVIDPLTMHQTYRKMGNPFMWWMFMCRGNGGTIYHRLFWIFPTLLTGAVFVDERSTAVCGILLTKQSRSRYFFSKAWSAFAVALFSSLGFFLLNLGLVYLVCPTNMEISDYLIPKEGSLAAWLYAKSPLMMAVAYNLMGALAMALLTVLYQQIQMILRLKNKYVALIAPVLLLHVLDYIVELSSMGYSLEILLQPVAASALTMILSSKYFIQVFGTLVLADIVLYPIAVRRNRDIL